VPADFDRGTKPSIAVIGGGIAGLTTAYEILERSQRQERGVDVLCLEASDRPGGNIRSTARTAFSTSGPPTVSWTMPPPR